ncbi:hypothetical protein [Yimella sp. RIT 621]|uniref:hypothetical protein n=1 Tax=Yimella sp. RIT 621 TaxID=2510323 RepID=UPI001459FEB9|nr:hypothetical protein [Yimella sp. RIT 621]
MASELGRKGHALVSTELAAAVQLESDPELGGDRQRTLNGLRLATAVGRHDRLFRP